MAFESKRRLFVIAAVVLLLLFSVGMVRDLLLDEREIERAPDAPPIVVEGLDVIREERGNDWHLKAERVEKRENVSEAEDLDIRIVSGTGTRWEVTAERGVVFETSMDVHLFFASGHISHSSGELEWKAPRADWDDNASIWKLPEGFEARDRQVVLEGSRGGITMSGSVVVEEGAVVTWHGSAR